MQLRPFHLSLSLVACLAGCLSGAFVLSTSAHTTATGESLERFGFQVLGTDDITGDGHADLVVAAPNPGADKVYIFPGPHTDATAALDTDDAWTFTGSWGGEAGWSLGVGNVVGSYRVDHPDLVIAAPSELSGAGQIHIADYGSFSGDFSTTSYTLVGEHPADYAGWDVAVGDFNGDHKDDVLVGACGYDDFSGAVYVVHGPLSSGTTQLANADVILLGDDSSNGQFGCAVAASDLNNDGADEIIVGARGVWVDGNYGAGEVHVVYSVANGEHHIGAVTDRAWLQGSDFGQYLGFSLDGGQDVNGDGIDDLLIGSPYDYCHQFEDHPAVGEFGCTGDTYGEAYLLLGALDDAGGAHDLVGGMPVEDAVDFTLQGSVVRGSLGVSVSMQADVNGDGLHDMLVGSRGEHRAWLMYGASAYGDDYAFSWDTSAHAVFDGTADGLVAGLAVAGVPDLDGDGYDELLIGAPGQEWIHDLGQQTPGKAYLYFGE